MSIRLMALAWQLKLSSTEKLVLLALADSSSDKGICWPAVSELCDKTGLSDRSIQHATQRFVARGWLTIHPRYKQSSLYDLNTERIKAACTERSSPEKLSGGKSSSEPNSGESTISEPSSPEQISPDDTTSQIDWPEAPSPENLSGETPSPEGDSILPRTSFVSTPNDVRPLKILLFEKTLNEPSKKNRQREPSTRARAREPTVERVFEHWRVTWNHPRAVLDAKRRKRIEARLAERTAEELCDAISGFLNSDWHTGRDPKGNGVVYDGIETLLRDNAQVEKGMRLFAHPPRPPPKHETATDRMLRMLNGNDDRVIDHEPEPNFPIPS